VINKDYRYFFLLLRLYGEFNQIKSKHRHNMDFNFSKWALDTYGIEINFGSDSYVLSEYYIKDPKKHILFMLQYSDLLGDLQ